MGVAAEIGEDLLGAAEGLLGIDDPRLLIEAGAKLGELGRVGAVVRQGELVPLVELGESFEQLAAEDDRHGLDREEEAAAGGDPVAVVVEAAGRDDAMDMGMKAEVACPGMQDRGHAELGVQTAASEVEQGARGGGEEKVVHPLGVLAGQGAQFLGQREDDVEVLGGDEALPALFEPASLDQALAFRTMAIAARVVGGGLVAAFLAHVRVTAEIRGPTQHDGKQHLELVPSRHVLLAKGRTGGAKDVGDLQARTHLPGAGRARVHGGEGLSNCRALPLHEPVQGTRHPLEVPRADPGIVRRGLERRMAEQRLDDSNVGAGLEKVRGESVTKRVQGYPLVEADLTHCRPERSAEDVDMDRPS